MSCMSPLRIVHKSKVHWVACGNCVNCIILKQNHWVFRIEQEYKVSHSAKFVTLTYDDNNVPQSVNPDTGELFLSLDYSDIQKYMKRLRKRSKFKIKHYTVGEYGNNTLRPHYHQIIFNATNDDITKAWQQGFTYFGDVTEASVRYVTKYMGKRIKHKPDDSCVDPMQRLSQGLGKSYLTPEIIKYHKSTLRDFIKLNDGKILPMPRYLKLKIFTEDELRKIKLNRELKSENDLEILYQKFQGDHKKLNEYLIKQDRIKHNQARIKDNRLTKKSKSL